MLNQNYWGALNWSVKDNDICATGLVNTFHNNINNSSSDNDNDKIKNFNANNNNNNDNDHESCT